MQSGAILFVQPTENQDNFWVCQHQVPPFYPNLITLEKHLTLKQIERLHELLKEGLPTEVGIKDSYANLDLNEKISTYYLMEKPIGGKKGQSNQNSDPQHLVGDGWQSNIFRFW